MKRFLWLGLVAFLFLICLGCGDTFRPVIIPNPPAFPDPRASHSAMSVNDNGSDRGSNMVINVSGDSVTGVADMGVAPVHAVQQTANQVLVVNHSFTGGLGDSLTRVNFSGTTISSTSTISLPPNSAPNFVATTESNQAYVSLPGFVPPSVAVVAGNVMTATIPVGANPVAMAETPNGKKLYVANEGSDAGAGTVSSINTIDHSLNSDITSDIFHPLWLVNRSDNQRLYVLSVKDAASKAGTLATFDTNTDSEVPNSILPVGLLNVGDAVDDLAPKAYMVYDGHLNRLYIPSKASGGGGQLVVVGVSQSAPQILATVSLPAPGVSVAALPDGSRAYAASNGDAQTTTIGTISSVSGDGSTATYTFDPISVAGPAPQLGMSLTISSDAGDGFDGTFIVTAASASTFQVTNITSGNSSDPRSATGTNFLPQITVINTSGNFVKTTITMPAVPASGPFSPPICATARFRFAMAAGGDSSRVYMSSCDAGGVSIIDTATDTYIANLPAPGSTRAPIPPDTQPPPQNPVFLVAGP